MSKEKGRATRRLSAYVGYSMAAATVCTILAPLAVRAEDKKFLIGIVELQLANPFFGKLEKAAVDTAKKHGLEVMTAEAKTAGELGHANRRDREHDQSRSEGDHP